MEQLVLVVMAAQVLFHLFQAHKSSMLAAAVLDVNTLHQHQFLD